MIKMKNISQFFNNLSIKYKLLVSYFILIIIPLGILTWLTYTRSADVIQQKMLSLTARSLEQTSISLTGKFENAINTSNTVFYNVDIQRNLSMDVKNYSMSKQIDDADQMIIYLKNLEYANNVFKIRLYVNDGFIYSRENINLFSVKDVANTGWYLKAVKDFNKVHWSFGNQEYTGMGNKQNNISVIRAINSYKSLGEPVGVVCVDIPGKNIHDILKENNVTEEGIIYIADENGTIISCSDDQLLNSKFKGIDSDAGLPRNELEWKKINFRGRTLMTGYKNINSDGWKLFAVVPVEDILTPSVTLRNYSFILMVVISIVAYLLALYVAFFIVKRINGLIKNVRKAQKGNLDVKIVTEGKDEIGELEKNFNAMLESISVLIEDKYKMGQNVKSAELKALQAQINPHFLYNTLDLISWRAKRYKAHDIEFLVNALAKFYKLSLSNGRDIISIGDEIAHVEVYVQIQNRRFKDGIKLEINVDQEILDNSIMKLILQPIVENSILHGIMNKPVKKGTISISAFLEEDMVVLKVRDDGIGMNEEKLSKILQDESPRHGHGYGIRNVNERIKLHYGDKYGLSYTSTEGEGTEAEIRIPLVK